MSCFYTLEHNLSHKNKTKKNQNLVTKYHWPLLYSLIFHFLLWPQVYHFQLYITRLEGDSCLECKISPTSSILLPTSGKYFLIITPYLEVHNICDQSLLFFYTCCFLSILLCVLCLLKLNSITSPLRLGVSGGALSGTHTCSPSTSFAVSFGWPLNDYHPPSIVSWWYDHLEAQHCTRL